MERLVRVARRVKGVRRASPVYKGPLGRAERRGHRVFQGRLVRVGLLEVSDRRALPGRWGQRGRWVLRERSGHGGSRASQDDLGPDLSRLG